jgi:hypothetical protein
MLKNGGKMLGRNDLIQFKCEKSIMQAGIEEASRAAAQPGRYPQINSFDRIRLRAADNMVELGFRRCLVRRGVPHQLSASPDFIGQHSYDVSLGGRRCIPVAQMICRRGLIRNLGQTPQQFLQRKVYLPERVAWEAYGDEDLYVFGFLTGLVTRSREAIKQAVVAGEPLHLLYRMPLEWSLPERWELLEALVLKTDLSKPVILTLHGQDGHQKYCTQQVELPGRKRIKIESEFFNVGALQINRLPKGPLGIHNPISNETLLAAPYQWGNVWVYGIRIVLAGYIRRRDFHRQAERANLAEALSANPCLENESLLALPVSELNSLPGLFQKAAAWENR